jgi:hypothetical protein
MAKARKQTTPRRKVNKVKPPSPRDQIAGAALALRNCADYGTTLKAYLRAIQAIAAGVTQTEAIIAIQRLAFPAECTANSLTLHAEHWVDSLAKVAKKGGAR